MSVCLGAIADDLTGATDLANMLARAGMRTLQTIGVPEPGQPVPDSEAVVVALKSRTIPAGEAVDRSLAALAWLRGAGVRQVLFKYCSTFDSRDDGNIGPVAAALLDALGGDFTIFCPAFPENGRSIYQGHLFVGDRLLNESGMQDHPLTPMTDPDLRRVLARQVEGPVGHVAYRDVRRGVGAIGEAYDRLRREGIRYAIVDAITDQDLVAIGDASCHLPLITGGSGIALGLPSAYRARGLLTEQSGPGSGFPVVRGPAAILSGSCSTATLGQVSHFLRDHPGFALDPERLAAGEDQVGEALRWAEARLGDEPVLISSSAPAERVRAAQQRLGRDAAGHLVEDALGRIAAGLAAKGVRRFVVAGGETSGAVIAALGCTMLQIGPQIDPGVPWTATLGPDPLALALKSGNFGGPDFFTKAFLCLP